MDRSCRSFKPQRGVTLVTSLVFLVIVSLLAVSSMRGSTLGTSMAQNEEARLESMQVAQALGEAILGSPSSTPVIGGAGFANCTAGETGCDRYLIDLPAGLLQDEVAAGNLSARFERLTPPDRAPPRTIESSMDKFSAASFQIVSTYDRSDEGLGRSRLSQGLLILVPKE